MNGLSRDDRAKRTRTGVPSKGSRNLWSSSRAWRFSASRTPRSIDAISSYGERLSSFIVTQAFRHSGMQTEHLDSRDLIVTDKRHTQAAPLFPQTYARLAATVPPLAAKSVIVMGGFIAASEDGVTTTLGRGGSDFTASIVGAGIGAEEIQIWTDVDGMLTADPTILPGGHRVKTISFAEAAELAYFGAKVLHPATVLPAIEKSIPVLILNSPQGPRAFSHGPPGARAEHHAFQQRIAGQPIGAVDPGAGRLARRVEPRQVGASVQIGATPPMA